MNFDANAALTTPAGRTLDPRFFFDFDEHASKQSRRNQLDRDARALILEAQKKIILYKSNAYYVSNRPDLNRHVGTLIDLALGHADGAGLMAHGPSLIPTIVHMLLCHEDGETLFEPQSFSQKANSTLPPIPLLKTYETTVAVNMYHAAQGFAARGKHEAFLTHVDAIRGHYAKFDAAAEYLESDPDHYAQFMHDSLTTAMDRVRILNDEAFDGISHADWAIIQQNDLDNFTQYVTVENSDERRKSVPALVAKTIDKNCALYTAHDRQKTVADLDRPLRHETSVMYRKTVARSLEYLPVLWELSHAGNHHLYYTMASTIAYDHVRDYTERQKNVIALTDAGAALEPGPNANHDVYDHFFITQDDMFTQRRETTCQHALHDRHYMSRAEIIAKVKTQQQRGDSPDIHFLDNDTDYTKRRGYRRQFDIHLSNTDTTPRQLPLFA